MSASPSPLGRGAHRAGSAALIAVAAGGVVSLLFAHPEPAALADDRPAHAVTVTTTAAATAPAGTPTTTPPAAANPPASTTPTPTPTPRKPVLADPRTVAAGWYATRHNLPVGKVRVLQADQLTPNRVRVLLMVERANGHLDSAIVTVVRSGNAWTVRS